MGSPAVPARTLLTLRLLQTSCGLLAVASLVALGRPPPAIVAHDGATTAASVHPAVPTEWSGGGPLAIPTIGVVPPGTDDWFDPEVEPTFRAQSLPTSVALPSTTEAPARVTEEPASTSPPSASTDDSPAGTSPTPTTEAPTSTGTTPTTTTSTTTTHSRTTTPATTTPGTTSPQTTAPPVTTTPVPTETTTPTLPSPPTNARGNVVLAFGDELTVFDTAGAAVFAIAVDGVTVDVTCTDPASTPAAGRHLVAVQLRVRTGPDLTAVGGEPAVRAADFRLLAPDGARPTEVGSADTCLPDTEEFPTGPIQPGRELAGAVVLDVPATTGTLVYAPDFLTVGAEWEFAPPAAG